MTSFENNDAETVKPRLYKAPPMFVYNPAPWKRAEIFEVTTPFVYAVGYPDAGDAKQGELRLHPDIAAMCNRTAYGTKITRGQYLLNLKRDGMTDMGLFEPDDKRALLAFYTRSAIKNSAPQLLSLQFNSNGKWSYRPPCEMGCGGNGAPTQVDVAGNDLTNLLEADFGVFDELLGFAQIPKEGIECFARLDTDPKLFFSP